MVEEIFSLLAYQMLLMEKKSDNQMNDFHFLSLLLVLHETAFDRASLLSCKSSASP